MSTVGPPHPRMQLTRIAVLTPSQIAVRTPFASEGVVEVAVPAEPLTYIAVLTGSNTATSTALAVAGPRTPKASPTSRAGTASMMRMRRLIITVLDHCVTPDATDQRDHVPGIVEPACEMTRYRIASGGLGPNQEIIEPGLQLCAQ